MTNQIYTPLPMSNTSIEFGTIVLVAFPFTDLTATKVRPAIVLSRRASAQGDVVVCFITSQKQPKGTPLIPLAAGKATGLKVPSFARLDKIATLEHTVLIGKLGRVPRKKLREHRRAFFRVFGF